MIMTTGNESVRRLVVHEDAQADLAWLRQSLRHCR